MIINYGKLIPEYNFSTKLRKSFSKNVAIELSRIFSITKSIDCLWNPKEKSFSEIFLFKWFYQIRQFFRLTYKVTLYESRQRFSTKDII